jgi:hypothetical protein
VKGAVGFIRAVSANSHVRPVSLCVLLNPRYRGIGPIGGMGYRGQRGILPGA